MFIFFFSSLAMDTLSLDTFGLIASYLDFEDCVYLHILSKKLKWLVENCPVVKELKKKCTLWDDWRMIKVMHRNTFETSNAGRYFYKFVRKYHHSRDMRIGLYYHKPNKRSRPVGKWVWRIVDMPGPDFKQRDLYYDDCQPQWWYQTWLLNIMLECPNAETLFPATSKYIERMKGSGDFEARRNYIEKKGGSGCSASKKKRKRT